MPMWESKAIEVCKQKELKVIGFNYGWVFVKNNSGQIYPIREETVAIWVNVLEEFTNNSH